MKQEILDFFSSVGLPLTHFPEDPEEGFGETWEYDGTDASGVGVTVVLTEGINGHCVPGVFGSVDLTDLGGSDISVSFSEETWMQDGPPWVRKHLRAVGLLSEE